MLDFGLAKVLEDEPPASSLANSPTLTMGHTRAGVILGTAAYMSPEQAVGRPVDRRSDIFSFGAVLYEMLTGKRAFPGTTTPDVLEAVVKSDPDWSSLPPTGVENLLRRCLAKDRKQRLQAIGEARIVLSNPTQITLGQVPDLPPKSGKLAWAAAAVLSVALGFTLWAPWRANQPWIVRWCGWMSIWARMFRCPLPAFGGSSVAISPDGTRLAYVSGKSSKAVHPAAGSTESHRAPGNGGSTWRRSSRRTGSGSDSPPAAS